MPIRIPHPKLDKVVYVPDFNKINEEGIKILFEKFYPYGNSWMRENSSRFWINRLTMEVQEVLEAKTPEDFKKEINDVINVLGMMYENADEIFKLKNSVLPGKSCCK